MKDGLLHVFVGASFVATVASFFVLTSDFSSADTTATASASVTVSAACSLAATNTAPHTAIINPGVYQADIGITTLKATCNDPDGFAIYAIGYTDTTYGKTTLTANVGGQLSPSNDITTGTATSGTTSKWAMKLNATSPATYPITLDNGYGSYSVVPTDYTKVAHRSSATDAGTSATGSELTTTYAAYIASNQAAGTYNGKVKYTLVHPAEHVAPVPVSKNLYYAITGQANNYTLTISDSDITSGAVAGGPVNIDGYTFNENEGIATTPWFSYANQIKSVVVDGTVAPTSTSAWFATLTDCDLWDLAGLRTDHVTDMSYMFYYAATHATTFSLDVSSWDTSNVTNMRSMFASAGYNTPTFSLNLSSWDTSNVTNMRNMFNGVGSNATTFTLSVSSWDTSNVTNMSNMFASAGYNATTWSVGNLSSWDTSNVTDMSGMFLGAGYSATAFSLGISSWDTSNVTDMYIMFNYAGHSATTFALDLSSWDTSNVTNMRSMFAAAGSSATTFTLNLSSWDTSNVTEMFQMFYQAGYGATNWSIVIPPTNNGTTTGSIANTASRLYGKTSLVYIASPSGKSFTLAQ